MYHDEAQSRRRRLLALLAACALAVLAVLTMWGLVRRVSKDMAEQSAVALKNTVIQAAVQCYAVEGTYPPTLEYLEQSYGLQINHETFIVGYEAFASNRLPDVQVLTRQ